MPIGPTLIIDKSTLQGLTVEEAEWLSHHFHPNLISPLFIEIVGTLTASDRDDPIADVVSLARKMLGMGLTTTPNMRHEDLAIGNLLGLEFEMDGRIILGGGQRVLQPDGRVVLFYDEPPEIEALRRLATGTFTDREKIGAALLRKFIAEVDLRRIRESLEGILRKDPPKGLSDALRLAEKILEGRGRYDALKRAMTRLRVPAERRADVILRWKGMGGPLLKDFAPYSYHVLRVDWCFDISIGSGLIPTRDSKHFIDVMYLYYLPFCEVFVSTDKFHRQIVPFFLRDNQRFIWGGDIKADAAKLAAYYTALPEDIRRTGSLNYARLPPKEGDLLVAKIFDELRPGWRDW